MAVILIVPIGIFGALLFVYFRGMENDIYLQVGLLTTGGLSAKNAILIVEYAHQFRQQGRTLLRAAQEAAALRFRPIVMTSVAFLLGVLPLLNADGAGSASQQSIGTGVFGGTVAATTLGLIMVPVFFAVISLMFHPIRRSIKLAPVNSVKANAREEATKTSAQDTKATDAKMADAKRADSNSKNESEPQASATSTNSNESSQDKEK